MKRKIMACLISASLLLSMNGVALASEKVSADEAVGVNDVIAKYNESVEKSYLGKAEGVDAGLITDAELLKQLENKNKYLANVQSPYQVINHEFDFKVLETKVNGDKAAVLGERVIKQKLSDKANKSEAFDSFVKEKEGYVLVKRDGKWVIDRVIIGFGDASPVLQSFEAQLKERASFGNNANNRLEQIVTDSSGINYGEAVKDYNFPNRIKGRKMDDISVKADMNSVKIAYSKKKAANYALTWGGSNRNPQYTDYSNSGGDCANFTSQCLRAGGLPDTASWKPDAYQWINVNGQRDALINTGRAEGYYQKFPVYPSGVDLVGTVLHYTDGSQWYHATIITKDYGNNSVRVTGHTADVINGPMYPLSKTRSFRVK